MPLLSPSQASSSEERDVLDTLTGKVLDYYNSAHVFDFYYEVRVQRGDI